MSDSSWKAHALAAQALLHAVRDGGALDTAALAELDAAISARSSGAAPAAAPAGAQIYTFGSNEKGALGHGHARPPGWEPARRLELPAAVAAVFAGESFTGVVTDQGGMLLAGSNASCAFADRAAQPRPAPVVVEALAGRFVSRVYTAGSARHIMAIVDGRLHAWGTAVKAVGLGTGAQTVTPTPVEQLGAARYEGGVPAEHIADVATWLGHTVLVTQDGEVFASGLNARGQLGFGAVRNPYDTNTFGKCEGIDGLVFVRAAAGQIHSALITDAGHLYTCGANEHGQLGLPGPEDRYRLTRVDRGSLRAHGRVVAVACGGDTTLCITEDGTLHGAGSNDKGQLGLGELTLTDEPTRIPLPEGKRVTAVAAGQAHALCLCEDGTVFGWGDNSRAQVTPGDKGRPVREPVRVETGTGTVVAIAAGKAHSVVVGTG